MLSPARLSTRRFSRSRTRRARNARATDLSGIAVGSAALRSRIDRGVLLIRKGTFQTAHSKNRRFVNRRSLLRQAADGTQTTCDTPCPSLYQRSPLPAKRVGTEVAKRGGL